MMSMLIGGFALGQASPDFAYFAAGREAAARLMSVINRQPEIAVHGGTVPDEPMHVLLPPAAVSPMHVLLPLLL